MFAFLIRRLAVMSLTVIVSSIVVFALVNLEPNLTKLARAEGNMRMTDVEVESWLEREGFRRPFVARYLEWGGNLLTGDLGRSTVFRKPVNDVLLPALGYTGILMFWVMVTMVPAALIVGVVAGMREGSKTDRSLSIFSILTTSLPEYVSGILFAVIFVSMLGWLKGVAPLSKVGDYRYMTLPVMTMAIYGLGYIARMTRASMTEVMTSQYIRTARLKGLSFFAVVLKHALRNALIAPFTVIMLQFTWLLTGVIIVERLFAYKGFGWALVQAAENNDMNLLLGCTIISVIVVILTQLISDIGYAFLNPRIRVS